VTDGQILPSYVWAVDDLRHQLGDAFETLKKLQKRVAAIRTVMQIRVEEGEGMTHQELVEVYVAFVRLFPANVETASEGVDDRSRST